MHETNDNKIDLKETHRKFDLYTHTCAEYWRKKTTKKNISYKSTSPGTDTHIQSIQIYRKSIVWLGTMEKLHGDTQFKRTH